jgi:GNAT superfamily N-acetyltransferase
MIPVISADGYKTLLPLFQSIDYQLAPLAVLQQAAGGRVWVDAAETPGSVLLQAGHRYHLGGDPANEAFNHSLRQFFTAELLPQLTAAGGWGFMLYFCPGWEAAIEQTLLPGCEIYPGARQYYELTVDPHHPPASPLALPDGFSLHSADAALVNQPDLGGRDDLLEEMQSERESVEDFLARSFGSCLIHDGAVATWCLSEYNLEQRCEIGIATTEAFRQRGLATLTGQAFIRQAGLHGLTRLGWHCWTRNEPSAAAARKLGFQKILDYGSYFVAAPKQG